eukprot:13969962-Alexandrium_andersonii.AAC.1
MRPAHTARAKRRQQPAHRRTRQVRAARIKRRQQPAHVHVQGPRPGSIRAYTLECALERQRSTVDHCRIYDAGICASAF